MKRTPSYIKLEDKLRQMKYKKFLHNTMTLIVLSWKYDGEYCTIATDVNWVTRPVDEMLKYIEENFQEVEMEEGETTLFPVKQQTEEARVVTPMEIECRDLRSTLKDIIGKTSENKDFVNQANAISSLAGKFIDAIRTEVKVQEINSKDSF